MSPIRMRDGQILMAGGQLVNRADDAPSCCCPPPEYECCDGENIPAEVYMDIDGWQNGYCPTPPKCEDAGMLNATGFVLPYIHMDSMGLCIYQHAKTLASFCGGSGWRYVLTANLFLLNGYKHVLGSSGFSTDDYRDDFGVYSAPSGEGWAYLSKSIQSCMNFDVEQVPLGGVNTLFHPCYINGYNENSYMRVYT
jgi:hypothetical protein